MSPLAESHEIRAVCDYRGLEGKPCDKAEDYGVMNDIFTERTRYDCLDAIRRAGWMLSHNRRGMVRAATCLCPAHAEERRSFHYRVPKK